MTTEMTPRERFIAALERRPLTGRVPHFELVFYLTMEAIGKIHPLQRAYGQWDQMEERERELHRRDMADVLIETAERYEHSAIFLHPTPRTDEESLRTVDLMREKTGDRYFLAVHGDATYGVPGGSQMVDFAVRLVEEPAKVKAEAATMVSKLVSTGTDQGVLVSNPGMLWQELADVHACHVGLDGMKLAPVIGRRIRLQIVGFHVRRPARKPDKNHRRVGSRTALGRKSLGLEQVRESQSSKDSATELEHAAAMQLFLCFETHHFLV